MIEENATIAADTAHAPGRNSDQPARRSRRKAAPLRDADLLLKMFWTVPETAFMCRVGVRSVWRELSDPQSKFPRARHVCGRTLLVRDEVLAFLNRQVEATSS